MTSDNNELQTVIEAAKEGSTQRVKNTIELIIAVCEEQQKRNSLDFSVATIGKLCAELGGISAQSIRNEKQKRYQAIINAYHRKNSKKIRPRSKNSSDEWVNRISDANARWLASSLISENKNLRSELNTLREAPITIQLGRSKSEPYQDPEMSETYIKALKHFISSENLKKFDLQISEHGELINSDGKIMSKVGFTHAIEQIVTVKKDSF